jgi:hypothetical protein
MADHLLPWPQDVRPSAGCGINYSPRFSHGGGCSQTSLGDGSPSSYCKSFGKQRAIVSTAAIQPSPSAQQLGEVAWHCVKIPWRRYDDPARHAVVVTDAAGHVLPSTLKNTDAAVGEVCFVAAAAHAATTPGEEGGDAALFAVYYLPFRWALGGGSGSYCSFFLNSTETIGRPTRPSSPPLPPLLPGAASFVRFESKTPFDTRSPMEMMATAAELQAMLAQPQVRADYLTFVSAIANTTEQSVRLGGALPLPLLHSGPNTSAVVRARPGQYAVVQVAVLARAAVTNMTVEFHALGSIPASALTCFQTDGVDVRGRVMPVRPWSLRAGRLGALLIGIAVPEKDGGTGVCDGARDAEGRAVHTGSFALQPRGAGQPTTITISVSLDCTDSSHTSDQATIDTSDLARLERLRWLNSRVGHQPSVTRPYHPLQLGDVGANGAASSSSSPSSPSSSPPSSAGARSEHTLTVRGRTVRLGGLGLPAAISANGVELLAGGDDAMAFQVLRADGSNVNWAPLGSYTVEKDAHGTMARWNASSRATDESYTLRVEGSMEYDGYLNVAVLLTSVKTAAVADTRLVTTMHRSAVKYACGAGLAQDGAFFPYSNLSKLAWKWTDSFPGFNPIAGGPVTGGSGFRLWVGDVEAGLHLKLKGSDPGWDRPDGDPFGTSSAQRKGGAPLAPPAWQNGNLGGWKAVLPADQTVQLVAYTGKQQLQAGASLLYNFSLVATPTKGDYLKTETAKREHYTQFRHFHIPYGQWQPNSPADLHADPGATTIILHQSNRLNPCESLM